MTDPTLNTEHESARSATSPTIPPPQPTDLSSSLRRNIDALAQRRKRERAASTTQEKLAEAITSFAGSMWFVYIHASVYALWVITNVGLFSALPRFDPSFVILATEASVEAIFLSTFVLISQNRTAAAADKRADLDLHINLLTEHELTKLAKVILAVAAHLNVSIEDSRDLAEVQQSVAPEAVLDRLDAR